MLTLRQLQDWFKDLEVIINDVQVAASNLSRLAQPANSAEGEILKSDFFQYWRRQLMFVLIIQLCKLFVYSDQERRNFRKLFNCFRLEPYDKALIRRLRMNKNKPGLVSYKKDIVLVMRPFIEQINMHSELIHHLKAVRDKSLAHTDPTRELPGINVEDMILLAELAGKIHSEIKHRIFDQKKTFAENPELFADALIKKFIYFEK